MLTQDRYNVACVALGQATACYEAALAYELAGAGLPLRRQHPIPVRYRDVLLATGFPFAAALASSSYI